MYKYSCKILKWIDGDTVDLLIDLGFSTFIKQRIRLARVDTPERNQENFTLAKEFCLSLFPIGSDALLESSKGLKTDKYGRWIGEITNSECKNASTELLNSNYAKLYKD